MSLPNAKAQNPVIKSPQWLAWLAVRRWRLNPTVFLYSSLTFITLLYTALALLRYFSFGTFAHDLGIYTQGAWHFSQFQEPYSSIKRYNLLGDHFVPVLALLAPFYWLRNSAETLLVAQVLIIMSGALPAWWLARLHLKQSWLQIYPPLFYALFFGHQSAMDYDAHPDTFAAAFFMWAIWAFERRKTGLYLLFLLLIVLCKETTPAYIAFFALYVLATKRQQWKLHLGLAVGGFALFFLLLNTVVPFLAGRPYFYTDYGELGKSMGEVVKNSLTKPGLLLKTLFGYPLKLETWLAFVLACGGAILIRPAFLILLLPNIIERFLNPLPTRWSVYLHYNSILAPFFTYSVIYALAKYEVLAPRFKIKPPVTNWLLGLGLAVVLLLNTFLYANYVENGLTDLTWLAKDRSAVWEAIDLIPATAVVLTNDRLVPHLAHRQHVDEFEPPEPPRPELAADYVLLSLEITRTAEERQKTETYLQRYQGQADFKLIFQKGQTFLFKKA